jgi:hypothetical protein
MVLFVFRPGDITAAFFTACPFRAQRRSEVSSMMEFEPTIWAMLAEFAGQETRKMREAANSE